jgi:hypothetical protein
MSKPILTLLLFFSFMAHTAFAIDQTNATNSQNLTTNPSYQNGTLSIPAVDTPDQVGKYLDVKFTANQDGSWTLNSFKETGVHSALAPVDSVGITTVTASPIQVFLTINGQFTSGCGKIGQINTRLDKNTFNVTVHDGFDFYSTALCAAVMVPFEKVIALPVFELKAGTYDFYVNGKRFGDFTLDTDNNLNIPTPPCCKN